MVTLLTFYYLVVRYEFGIERVNVARKDRNGEQWNHWIVNRFRKQGGVGLIDGPLQTLIQSPAEVRFLPHMHNANTASHFILLPAKILSHCFVFHPYCFQILCCFLFFVCSTFVLFVFSHYLNSWLVCHSCFTPRSCCVLHCLTFVHFFFISPALYFVYEFYFSFKVYF